MRHVNRLLGPGRAFCLLFLSLLVAGTQLNAQAEKDADHPACPDPSCPKIEVSLNKPNCAETPIANGIEASCDLRTSIEPPAPVQPPVVLQNDRLFFLLANYTTVENQQQFVPLPAKTKFILSMKTMSDPVTVSFLGVIALMGQAQNSYPSYGQGFQGYGKRYATTFANTGIGTLMTTSVFPTLLHQDPRYFQLGSGSKRRRMKYAVASIFVARADSGKLQFNYSEIVGNAVAAGISNTYIPQSQRTLGNTLSVWGTDILLNTICNVAKEFWPDLRRKLRKQAPPDQAAFPASEP